MFWYVILMILPQSLTISVSPQLTFSVAGISISGFAICFFATVLSDPIALRLPHCFTFTPLLYVEFAFDAILLQRITMIKTHLKYSICISNFIALETTSKACVS